MKEKVSDTILSNVTFKPVLNFDFSTKMLFRCTKRKFAEDIKKGRFFFNTPLAWIREEEMGNKGQGDKLEGTFFSVRKDDNSEFIKLMKSNKEIEHFEYQNLCYFRKKHIKNIFCLCFYGLNDSNFEREVDEIGRVKYATKITKDYFSDFSNGVSSEEYDELEKDEQPVVVMIRNPRKLFRKIREFFWDKGVVDEEIIISPVEYLDKKRVALSAVPFPRELLLKDIDFFNQSEVRVIINSNSPILMEYMEKHNNIIDVGDLSDFVEIYDYYFNDLLMEIKDNNVCFTRPHPVFMPLKEFDLPELVTLYAQAKMNDVPGECYAEISKEEYLKELKSIIEEEYDVKLLWDNKPIVVGVNEKLWKKFEDAQEPHRTINEFSKRMEESIADNNLAVAYELLEDNYENEILSSYTFFYRGILCVISNRFEEAIEYFTYCINNNINKGRSLDHRAHCYYQLKQYYFAINDTNRLQDLIGYSPDIYVKRGVNYIALYKYAEAIDEFNRALEMSPDLGPAYYNRGVANFKVGDKIQAEKDMKKAIELQPGNLYYKKEYERVFGIIS